MSKRRKGRKSARKKSFARSTIWFFVFLGAAFAVYVQGGELLAGVRVHLLGGEERFEVSDVGKVSSRKGSFMRVARVSGIPDYGSRIRFPFQGEMLTCFRMTGFENRLFVCTSEDMETPEEIGELLRPRSLEGKLVPLAKSKPVEPLTRGLWRAHRVRPHEDAFVLMEGESPVPSRAMTFLLMALPILCVISLYRVIKG